MILCSWAYTLSPGTILLNVFMSSHAKGYVDDAC